MALPALLRKLFKSSGYGSELNDGIISKIISNQDWSNSYDYPVGVVARGSDDVLYYSVAQSGPGTSAGAKDPAQGGNSGFWKSIGSGDSIPTGTVLWLSTTTVPAGYLLCNGSAVGRAVYPELFASIGTTYGAGDGRTTFNLPNLIDKFAEGSTVAGTVKAAGLPNITGKTLIPLRSNYGYGGTRTQRDGAIQVDLIYEETARDENGIGVSPGDVEINASWSNSIYGNSNTVQPPALTLLPCIKAFASVVGDATVVAGQLVNEIQSKVALDGSNVSSIGSTLAQYMANASMPSTSHIALSVPANGGDTPAMPCDGFLHYHARCNSGKTINPILIGFTDTNSSDLLSASAYCNVASWEANVVLPVAKGTFVRVYRGSDADSYERVLSLFPCIRH